MTETFTVWVTSYALTSGIRKVEVESSHTPTMVCSIEGNGNLTETFHGEGTDWHRTEQGALDRAEVMRVAKIASLKKSIAKLEKLKFRGNE